MTEPRKCRSRSQREWWCWIAHICLYREFLGHNENYNYGILVRAILDRILSFGFIFRMTEGCPKFHRSRVVRIQSLCSSTQTTRLVSNVSQYISASQTLCGMATLALDLQKALHNLHVGSGANLTQHSSRSITLILRTNVHEGFEDMSAAVDIVRVPSLNVAVYCPALLVTH